MALTTPSAALAHPTAFLTHPSVILVFCARQCYLYANPDPNPNINVPNTLAALIVTLSVTLIPATTYPHLPPYHR